MFLKWYQWPRLIVLDANATAYEAARAMEHNEIGTILIQQSGRIVGIVTDRDLTLRVIGKGLDPKTIEISEIMSTNVATLAPEASHLDAIRLMRERKVRRIPLLEGDKLVGIVTLDDLLLYEAVPLEELAALVHTQIGPGGPVNSPRRRRAGEGRAAETFRRMLSEIRINAGLETVERAEIALDTSLTLILRRLTANEAKDFIAQLPSLLQNRMQVFADGPNKSITREFIENEIARNLRVDPNRASDILNAIGLTLADNVSPGQLEEVRGQLPKDMKGIFASFDLREARSG